MAPSVSPFLAPPDEETLLYPETDGLPIAENTLQFDWITRIKENLDALFQHDPLVFVAGDLFWYPVQGDPGQRTAPGVLVAFGRPKGHRRSYLQWREGGVPPQVVFEILSPGNRADEMEEKRRFYERFGVEEYYLYDPDRNVLEIFLRRHDRLDPAPVPAEWTSPRLGVRFRRTADGLDLLHPDGEPFRDALELRRIAESERRAAESERLRAEEERLRAERLAARLRELGLDPDA